MNWQTPQELPDRRRVDTIAIDTETNDAGLRADRGIVVAGATAFTSAASAAPGARTAICMRYTYPCAIPTPTISIPSWSIAG